MNRKNLLQWLPWVLFALVLFTPLRPIVLGGVQRGLLATGLWKAEVPAAPAAVPVVLTSGTAYPHNLPMVTLDGQPVNLSELKGKVVFVNLWASWCPPCRAEMPGIEALYKKMDPAKVAFVMLSLDDDAAKARKFVKSQSYTFPVYLRTGNLPAPFDSNSIPSTVILGPDGQVAARHDGMAEYDTSEFKAALEKLSR
ncbi:thiol-disulfide isomerase/thioredoxin [Hymenobacter luteus]|uniref:TlpA family protein disulfide reductase n=3 Tax=Hymenobacter TaxID=89966 RepID=A0A428IZZ0_9BACT|nr:MULTISPECIES: TlpA disulfide reductase family protein [Hymenobacter]MBB4603659.1 thiol-disulfide isomerase/thioredoxin [Hymenobacter latericoloratus]MBB6061406.1 thiol-disulfide isomerase/thioredoxin [Hymenobacter luteus]RSK25018.1 TlpA family protein disulfide reductase [Hymenobacter metallilatus]